MDTIYGYFTRKWGQGTRYSPEIFIEILKNFYDNYTNTKLEKIKLEYWPKRLSDQDDYNQWQKNCSFGGFKNLYAPPETDEEVKKNLKYISNLNILNMKHMEKNKELNIYQEKYIFEIDLSSYNELLALIEAKNCITCSYFFLKLENRFDFLNFNYSKSNEITGNYNGNNRIEVHLGNNPEYINRAISFILNFSLILPNISDNDKDFLRQIEKELKIKFQRKQFHYYIKKNGKWKTKKTELIL